MADNSTGIGCPKGANAYVLRQGETIAAVAERFGVDEEEIRRINPGLSGEPQPGETICVPRLRCPDGQLYIVHKADTFTSIAKKYGISVAELSAANPFVDPDVIAVGQVICIPAEKPEPQPPEQQPEEEEEGGGCCVTVCLHGMVKKKVCAGESYADILIAAGLSYAVFRLLNPALRPGALFEGQEYIAPAQPLYAPAEGGGRLYCLQEGEDLRSAAQKLGTGAGALLSRNPALAPSDFAPGACIRC